MSIRDVDERQPLLGDGGNQGWPSPVLASAQEEDIEATPPVTKVYTRRWYILAAFCLMNFSQNIVWNTWAPISASAEEAFGWDDSTIALQTNWGPIAFIVSALFFAWVLDVKGLRFAVLPTAGLVMVGSAIRCISSTPPTVTWLNHIGQLLNGFAGPVCMSAQPVLSATWFPPHQRTTATAIGSIMGSVGVAVSFIIGPLFVPDLHNRNSTSNMNTSGNHSDISILRNDIMRLVYVEAGISAASFLLILLYFPSRPPVPPSISSTIQRLNFKEGFLKLIKHRKFWTLGLVYGISSGVFNAWSSVIDVNLKAINVSQSDAGWLGFYGIVAGNIATVLISVPADHFKRKMKWFLLVLYFIGAVSFLIFALVCIKVIPFNIVWLYVTMIAGSIALVSGVPLFYELVCEATYPIAEGVTNSMMTLLNNIAALAFYFVLLIPDKAWMNWAMLGSVVICIPLILFYQQRLGRYEVDVGSNDANKSSIAVNSDVIKS